MKLVEIYYGQTHAVANLGPKSRGRQALDLACNSGLEVNELNKHRYAFFEGEEQLVACMECKSNLGIEY